MQKISFNLSNLSVYKKSSVDQNCQENYKSNPFAMNFKSNSLSSDMFVNQNQQSNLSLKDKFAQKTRSLAGLAFKGFEMTKTNFKNTLSNASKPVIQFAGQINQKVTSFAEKLNTMEVPSFKGLLSNAKQAKQNEINALASMEVSDLSNMLAQELG